MTESPRAVVCGYGEMATVGLECLREAGFEIPLLLTHEADPVESVWWRSAADWARTHGIEVRVPREPGSPDETVRVARAAPDFLFSFYYRSMLPAAFLGLARRGALNLHGSLLPLYRGRAPVNWVLVRGETITGVTLHDMDEKPDHGDLVAQQVVPVADDDTALTLSRKMAEAAGDLLRRTLPRLRDGTVPRTPQDHARATYFGRRTPADGRIDWSWPAMRVYNLVRAVTHPWPGAFTDLEGRKVFVWWGTPRARVAADDSAPAGAVLGAGEGGVRVACGEAQLVVKRAQVEGGPVLEGSNALATLLQPGARLG